MSNMEVGILADLTRRVTDRPGDLPPLAARLAEVEQDLLLRRGRCNSAIATYNTYRAQIPQVMLSRLVGFALSSFPPSAWWRRHRPAPRSSSWMFPVSGRYPDSVVVPWPQRPL